MSEAYQPNSIFDAVDDLSEGMNYTGDYHTEEDAFEYIRNQLGNRLEESIAEPVVERTIEHLEEERYDFVKNGLKAFGFKE